ncbi:PucR family transcriptional regulator [Aeromicrobium sp. Sec7.5]|uniref:PucR family transcriptional regulator n=1 Tax=Aeromicrobium sp. Sec7.5 TaxID=3121276 RepID=UPI002FE447CC
MADSRGSDALRLPAAVVDRMRAGMAGVAEQTIAAVISEVPSYRDPFRGAMGRNIEVAVTLALDGFLDLAARQEGIDAGDQIETVREAAYALGRGEARSGRTMDALAQAYRVGARVSWREMSAAAVASGLDATTVARLAELVFSFIDGLSAASVSGHADELATSGRLRQQRLDRLATRLVEGAPESELVQAADRADWDAPKHLTAVIVPEASLRSLRGLLDPRSLHVPEDTAGLDLETGTSILLVPAAGGRERRALTRALRELDAVVGPARPWALASESYQRARHAHRLGLRGDTDLHLADLVVGADAEARADLRSRVLGPLDELSPVAQEKLADTLRAWLLHQGRRDDIAAVLFVHPQTVRYRMGQLRELYGERLTDPQFVRDATIALA